MCHASQCSVLPEVDGDVAASFSIEETDDVAAGSCDGLPDANDV